MKLINYLYFILFICFLTQSCRENLDFEEVTYPNIPIVSKVISSIHGNVVDDQGNLVSGAIVTFENESVETDENGVFQFLDKSMNKNGTFISVKKEGYFHGSRRFYPNAGTRSIVNIELITLEVNGSFNSTVNSQIVHDGVELEFPENAITNEDGIEFNGMVNVAIAYLDPSVANTLDQMPGDLTGTSIDGDFVALKSLGMIAVELMDDNGNKLQVKEGKLVDVKIPIPSDLRDAAPASIPMWHFNEDVGIWQEEGDADLVGNNYETSLAHFSFWNCDVPRNYVLVKGSLLNRGVPIQGIKVGITDNDNNISGYAITDENGMFCGFVPGGTQLALSVYNQCGGEIFSTTFTTSDEDIILDPLIVDLSSKLAMISGVISSCEGKLSPNSYVKFIYNLKSYTFPIQDDGSYQGFVSYCNNKKSIVILAYDPLLDIGTGGFSYDLEGDLEVEDIEICDEGNLEEYIIVEYGEVKRNLVLDDKLSSRRSVFGNGTVILYTLSVDIEVAQDSIIKNDYFVFFRPDDEHKVEIRIWESGFGAVGDSTNEIIYHNGKQYIKSTGTLTGISLIHVENYDPTVSSIYYDILFKVK